MPESPLSFHRAEYSGEPISLHSCTWCRRGLEQTCFRANGNMICAACAGQVLALLPSDSRSVFWRSVAWGAAASVGLGLALFALGTLLFPWRGRWTALVLASLGVGYAIGWVMRRASGGVGGRRYQIAAALWVYAAVSISAVALILGAAGMPVWAFPFFVLVPPVWIFVGRGPQAGVIFTMAVVGIRWAWAMLRPVPLRITGPETLSGAPKSAEKEA